MGLIDGFGIPDKYIKSALTSGNPYEVIIFGICRIILNWRGNVNWIWNKKELSLLILSEISKKLLESQMLICQNYDYLCVCEYILIVVFEWDI